MIKKVIGLVIFLIVALAAWFAWDVQSDRNKSIKIIKAVPLYGNWEPLNGQQSNTNVMPGENLKVVRIRYGKDYMAIKIEREDGSNGWIIYQNEAIELSGK